MNLKESIISTLAYHQIFDYPLTEEELLLYQIEKKTNKKLVSLSLEKLSKEGLITYKNGYFCLSKSNKYATLRKKRKNISGTKLKRATLYAKILDLIPTIKFVGLTGALAMQNSTRSDDIDLLIITSSNLLWTTRLLANIMLFPFKRRPKTQQQANKACLNIFIDGADLKIKDQNLYSAHEICQMKVLYNRGNTYQQFIASNKWVYRYLPNWTLHGAPINKTRAEDPHLNWLLANLEQILKRLQLKYMKSKITTEKISNTQLFFHPKTTQAHVLREYEKKLLLTRNRSF